MNIDDISRLACLNLTDEEKQGLQLPKILEHFTRLSEINTDGVEPMVTPIEMEQQLREDVVTNPMSSEEALKNAPEVSNNAFKVPPVV